MLYFGIKQKSRPKRDKGRNGNIKKTGKEKFNSSAVGTKNEVSLEAVDWYDAGSRGRCESLF